MESPPTQMSKCSGSTTHFFSTGLQNWSSSFPNVKCSVFLAPGSSVMCSLILDEWDKAENFEKFFADPEIAELACRRPVHRARRYPAFQGTRHARPVLIAWKASAPADAFHRAVLRHARCSY